MKIQNIIARLTAGVKGNPIDAEIEIALFRPCKIYTSVTANHAGSKLRYVRADGQVEVCWPHDWSADPAETITLLRAINRTEQNKDLAA